MNPCPCGYYNHPTKACVCSPGQVQKYLNKISGPLLDRIDIQIEIVPVPFEEMANNHPAEPSSEIRKRVIKARQIQDTRFADQPGIYCNAQMTSKLLAQYAQPDNKGLTLLKNAMNRLNLSARAYDRIKYRAPLPIWKAANKYSPLTWPKPSAIGIWTGRIGEGEKKGEFSPLFIFLFRFLSAHPPLSPLSP